MITMNSYFKYADRLSNFCYMTSFFNSEHHCCRIVPVQKKVMIILNNPASGY